MCLQKTYSRGYSGTDQHQPVATRDDIEIIIKPVIIVTFCYLRSKRAINIYLHQNWFRPKIFTRIGSRMRSSQYGLGSSAGIIACRTFVASAFITYIVGRLSYIIARELPVVCACAPAEWAVVVCTVVMYAHGVSAWFTCQNNAVVL